MAKNYDDFTITTTQTDDYGTGSKDIACTGFYRRVFTISNTTSGYIRIIWGDGHNAGIYSFNFLKSLGD